MDETKIKRSNVTILAVLTTITLLAWVFLEAYQRFNKIEITSISEKTLKELSPVLDREALSQLSERKHFSAKEIDIYQPSSSAPEIPATIESSESAQINKESTNSAQ